MKYLTETNVPTALLRALALLPFVAVVAIIMVKLHSLLPH